MDYEKKIIYWLIIVGIGAFDLVLLPLLILELWPEVNGFEYIFSFVGAIVGGGLTLTGVWLTIKHQKKVEFNRNINKQIMYLESMINIIKYYEETTVLDRYAMKIQELERNPHVLPILIEKGKECTEQLESMLQSLIELFDYRSYSLIKSKINELWVIFNIHYEFEHNQVSQEITAQKTLNYLDKLSEAKELLASEIIEIDKKYRHYNRELNQ